jgi:hypothetical protein
MIVEFMRNGKPLSVTDNITLGTTVRFDRENEGQRISSHGLMRRKAFLSRLHDLENEFGLTLNIDPYARIEIIEDESTEWDVDKYGRVIERGGDD